MRAWSLSDPRATLSGMTRWGDVAAAEPELAARVRRCFGVRKHATLATLRRDGSPRISGTEVEWADDGTLRLGMMPGSLKALDLHRDPRLALHCPTEDPDPDHPEAWAGDAKIAGRAVELPPPEGQDAHVVAVDVLEVVLTRVGETGDHLVIDSWHPGRGHERRERR